MAGYEKSDAHVPTINRFLFGLFVLIGVSMLAMWAMHAFLARQEEKAPRPTLMEAQRVLPPAPRLQVSNTRDLAALKAGEERALSTYGWVDKQAGSVRIPVERAMEVLAQRGLPGKARR
jgi:hypothetical protein